MVYIEPNFSETNSVLSPLVVFLVSAPPSTVPSAVGFACVACTVGSTVVAVRFLRLHAAFWLLPSKQKRRRQVQSGSSGCVVHGSFTSHASKKAIAHIIRMQLARHADHACVIHTWRQIPVLTSEECFFLLRFVPNLILTKKKKTISIRICFTA
jgi:hypothetical protein